jgi:hypothetical protein
VWISLPLPFSPLPNLLCNSFPHTPQATLGSFVTAAGGETPQQVHTPMASFGTPLSSAASPGVGTGVCVYACVCV